jgi:hypothetical protein
MALIEVNTNPTRRQLAVFGASWVVFVSAVGMLVAFRAESLTGACVLWAVAGAVPLAGLVVPGFLRGVYVAMAYAAFPVGWVVSIVVLAIVYFAVITPVGVLMRLLGRDPMTRRFDARAETYWVPHRTRDEPESYFRQF